MGATVAAATATLGPTLALAAVSVGVALGMQRLMTGDRWLLPMLAAALLPHALGLATRTRTTVVQVGVWTVGLLGFLVRETVLDTTRAGLPTPATLRALVDRVETGVAALRDLATPVPDRPGVVLLGILAVWCAAATADALAMRRRATIGALGPAVTVLVWLAALTPGTDAATGVGAAAVVVVAGGVFCTLQRQALRVRAPGRVGSGRAGPRTLVVGTVVAVVAAVVGVALAPRLPGADAPPLLDLRPDGPGSSTYQTSIPPLVDVADNLRRGERVELFTVSARIPQYWRTVALDRYSPTGGGQWTLQADGREIAQGLDAPVPRDGVVQRFVIGNLGERWMPAAFAPVSVSRADTLVVEESLTLVTEARSVRGLTYSVTSAPPPEPTPVQQLDATPPPPALRSATRLPAEVPAEVRDLAVAVTAGATTPYERARRLRDFFRNGSFTYDPEVDLQDSADATLEFLRTRRGFCVQFASTYALMARAVGLPARVAVGFTPGAPDPATGRYVVTNLDAHAWPEVWLPGIGWTNRFEPTPPSAGPGGSALPGDTAGTPVAPPVATPPTTARPVPGTPGSAAPETARPDADPGAGTDRSWWWVVVALAALVAVGVGARPGRRVVRRATRRRRPDPADRVAGAWAEAVDRLVALGAERPVHDTPAEVAARAADRVGPAAAPALGALADAHTTAQFARAPVTAAEADAAWTRLAEFRRAVRATGRRRRPAARRP
jgi:transglutaminase-like putative cysteine protease